MSPGPLGRLSNRSHTRPGSALSSQKARECSSKCDCSQPSQQMIFFFPQPNVPGEQFSLQKYFPLQKEKEKTLKKKNPTVFKARAAARAPQLPGRWLTAPGRLSSHHPAGCRRRTCAGRDGAGLPPAPPPRRAAPLPARRGRAAPARSPPHGGCPRPGGAAEERMAGRREGEGGGGGRGGGGQLPPCRRPHTAAMGGPRPPPPPSHR